MRIDAAKFTVRLLASKLHNSALQGFDGRGLSPPYLSLRLPSSGCHLWWITLARFGHPLPALATQSAYSVGSLGKYVPGKAMVLILRAVHFVSLTFPSRRPSSIFRGNTKLAGYRRGSRRSHCLVPSSPTMAILDCDLDFGRTLSFQHSHRFFKWSFGLLPS